MDRLPLSPNRQRRFLTVPSGRSFHTEILSHCAIASASMAFLWIPSTPPDANFSDSAAWDLPLQPPQRARLCPTHFPSPTRIRRRWIFDIRNLRRRGRRQRRRLSRNQSKRSKPRRLREEGPFSSPPEPGSASPFVFSSHVAPLSFARRTILAADSPLPGQPPATMAAPTTQPNPTAHGKPTRTTVTITGTTRSSGARASTTSRSLAPA